MIGAEDYGDWTRMLLSWEQCAPKPCPDNEDLTIDLVAGVPVGPTSCRNQSKMMRKPRAAAAAAKTVATIAGTAGRTADVHRHRADHDDEQADGRDRRQGWHDSGELG
ncbi:hypothetical protein, partial [Streptomyces sp. NPDC046942]|uniref:hypothetical protein n=1 Tax=Streptomyces sp. NPDC046942 TaxID=3155137 RepID=UPI0033F480A0